MAIDTTQAYDTFSGNQLDGSKWSTLKVPAGEDKVWDYAEPDAKVSVSNGTLEIRVDPFTRAGVGVQIFDNPKHLLWSTTAFPVPAGSVTRLSCEMAAENIGGNPDDYRDGFAGFVNGDFQSLMIFDMAATSKRAYPLYERLFVPGMNAKSDAFTYVVDAPLAELKSSKPGQWHEYTVELDSREGAARWYIDGKKAFEVAKVAAMPQNIQIGLGVFTLCGFENDCSVSCKGQGMIGRWRNVRYSAS